MAEIIMTMGERRTIEQAGRTIYRQDLQGNMPEENTADKEKRISQIAENIFNQPNNLGQYARFIDYSGFKPILQQLGVSEELLNNDYIYENIVASLHCQEENYDLTTKEGVEKLVRDIDDVTTITEDGVTIESRTVYQNDIGEEYKASYNYSLDENGNFQHTIMRQNRDKKEPNEVSLTEISILYDRIDNDKLISATDRVFQIADANSGEVGWLSANELEQVRKLPDDYARILRVPVSQNLGENNNRENQELENSGNEEITPEQQLVKNVIDGFGKQAKGAKDGLDKIKGKIVEAKDGAEAVVQNLLQTYDVRDITNEMLEKSYDFIKNTVQQARGETTQEKENDGQEKE